jgi:serine/threonine protein kinase
MPHGPPSDVPPSERIGTVVAGRYRLIAQLGEGGIGVVYLAEDAVVRGRVAIKILRRELAKDAEVVARFDREAQALAALTDDHIVRALSYGRTAEGDICMVMELLDGETLRTMLKRLKPFPLPMAVEIALQIAAALARAHGLGVVHRDLKPENVMITWPAEQRPWVKVLDFGMARILGGTFGGTGPGAAPLTKKGAVFGTPEYMCPEQAMGRAVDAQADQYAFGVMVFEMLAGHRPFRATSPFDMLQMQIHDAPPVLSEIVPAVPPAVTAVVTRMMAKRPDERYPNIQAASAALVDAARGATNPPPSPDDAPQRRWWQIFSPSGRKT